jgi:hypothetical protein
MAIRNADTAGREETCQPAPRAPPPANRSPFPSSQQRLGSDRELIRDVVLAGPSRLRDGEDQSNVGEINVLASRQTRRPQQTALTQSLTERAAGAVPRIGKEAAETRPLKHRIAYVAFLTSVNRTDEGKQHSYLHPKSTRCVALEKAFSGARPRTGKGRAAPPGRQPTAEGPVACS